MLNAAIALKGELPIAAEATLAPRTADEPALVLYSRDLDAALYPRYAGEVLAYANPADPYALLKAAIVFRGLVPADAAPETDLATLYPGLQLRLATATTIPRGSGLGTSSILGGAVLRALDQLLGQETEQARLFDEVLCLEQMITTAGGWQDQIGGLAPGIKLSHHGPRAAATVPHRAGAPLARPAP